MILSLFFVSRCATYLMTLRGSFCDYNRNPQLISLQLIQEDNNLENLKMVIQKTKSKLDTKKRTKSFWMTEDILILVERGSRKIRRKNQKKKQKLVDNNIKKSRRQICHLNNIEDLGLK